MTLDHTNATTPQTVARVPGELIAFVVLVFVVPAGFIVPGLGALGSPATIVTLMLIGLLLLDRLTPSNAQHRPVTPVAIVLLAYLAFVTASWAAGRLTPLSPTTGLSADRALISQLGLTGLALFVIDRIRTWTAVIRLIDIMLLASMVMCTVGLIQFFADVDLSDSFRLPGLVKNVTGFDNIPIRLGLRRAFGTAQHPIEFGVVTAALAPLALWRVRSGQLWASFVLLILVFSSLASLSRSSILTLALVALVLFGSYDRPTRIKFLLGGAVATVIAALTARSLLDVIVQLFAGAGDDPSVQARQARTPEVIQLLAERPWFGRGYGTFTIEEFLLLDNQIQVLAIETGVVGVALFAAMIATFIWCALRSDRGRDIDTSMGFGTTSERRTLGVALVAAIAGMTVSTYTFDAFYYRVLSGVLYIMIGLVGVLWHFGRPDGQPPLEPARLGSDEPSVGRMPS